MREMSVDEFHDVIATYISQLSKQVDLSDPDTIVFTAEFDDMLRHIQSKPNAKLNLTYFREDASTKLLYKQLVHKLNNKDTIRIL